MEAQLTEVNTFPSQSYQQSFFSFLPSDQRFLQNSYIKITPTGHIDLRTLSFILEKIEAANVYMIQDAILSVRIKILTSTGKLPEITKNVAPRNNVLHTLWESCRLYINDVLLTNNGSDYNYKSYIANAISYPLGSKTTHMQTQGWYSDSAGSFDDCTTSNTGFIQRNLLFRDENDATKKYSDEGAHFVGRIFHDLISCESGLPPNTKIKIELDRALHSFVLQTEEADTEKYKVTILDAAVLLPVAQLSLSAYNELSNFMAKTNDGTFRNEVAIHYRRLEIRPVTIPNGNKDYYTKSLFSQSDNPCKITVCFVASQAKTGSYHKNPYDFRRSWSVEVSSAEISNYQSSTDHMTEIEDRVQSRLAAQLQTQFDDFAAKFFESTQRLLNIPVQSEKESDAERATVNKISVGAQGLTTRRSNVDRSANRRIQEYIESAGTHQEDVLDGPSTSDRVLRSNLVDSEVNRGSAAPSVAGGSNSSEYFSTQPASEPQMPKATKVTQYIRSINCTINSTPVDQVNFSFCPFFCYAQYTFFIKGTLF